MTKTTAKPTPAEMTIYARNLVAEAVESQTGTKVRFHKARPYAFTLDVDGHEYRVEVRKVKDMAASRQSVPHVGNGGPE